MTVNEALNVAYAHFITLSPEQHQIRDSVSHVLKTGKPLPKKNADGSTQDLGVHDPEKLAKLDQYASELEGRRGPLPVAVQADPNKKVDSTDLLSAMDALSGLP